MTVKARWGAFSLDYKRKLHFQVFEYLLNGSIMNTLCTGYFAMATSWQRSLREETEYDTKANQSFRHRF